MSFALGLVFFILGSVLVALCLAAIPGPGGTEATGHAPHDHDHAHH